MAHADIHADTHVFGSTRGYGTVASSRGVREDEARELESFQFGEASTADRIARLETHAVMTGRALRSGRFAISRMMPAGVDDAGRPTIEVITLLVEARDYAACVGALPQLASDARFWLDARATAASGARIAAVGAEPAPRDPQVLRLFDLWRGALRAGAIGVVSESESDAVLRLVASLDPADLLRCRWGIGLLSISTPADICSVASGVSMHGARDVLRPAQQGSWHCGSESEYAAFRAAQMPTLPSVADIEANGHTLVVAGDDGPMPAATVASPRRDARERRLMPLAIGSAVLSTAVLAVAAVMYGRREEVAPIVRGSTQESAVKSDETVRKRDALGDAIHQPTTEGPVEAEADAAPAERQPAPTPQPAPPKEPDPTPQPERAPPSDQVPPVTPTASPSDSPAAPPPTPPSGLPPADQIPPQRDYKQPMTLQALINALPPAEMLRRKERETDLSFRARVDQVVDRLILLVFDACMLDRTLKQAASEIDAASMNVPSFSGFMETVSKPSQFGDVPLNFEWQDEWGSLAEQVQSRLHEIEKLFGKREFDGYLRVRLEAVVEDVLDVERDGKQFLERKDAWDVAKTLLAGQLDREIASIKRTLAGDERSSKRSSK